MKPKEDKLKIADLISRIKWAPVAVLIVLILVVAFFLFSGQNIKAPFQESYAGEGDIKARAWADPAAVMADESSKAKVEVKNEGKEAASIKVKLSAYDKSLVFDETGAQEVNASIDLGPKEQRELSFKVDFNATYPGKYGVKVTVSPGGENIINEVFFDVKEKKEKN